MLVGPPLALLGLVAALMVIATSSCCSGRRPGVVVLNTGKMVYETGSATMYLAGKKVTEMGWLILPMTRIPGDKFAPSI